MATLFRRNNFMRTLYTKSNDNVYEIDNVIIMKNGKEWITKGAYEVFDGGIDLGIDVVRRLKVDTGLKNKDKVFIVKTEKQSVWNDNTVYDMYIDNDLLEFKEVKKELYNVEKNVGIETTFRSDQHDLGFTLYTAHTSETTEKKQAAIHEFGNVKERYVSYLNDIDETKKYAKKYAKDLIKAANDIEKYHELAKAEVLELLKNH